MEKGALLFIIDLGNTKIDANITMIWRFQFVNIVGL